MSIDEPILAPAEVRLLAQFLDSHPGWNEATRERQKYWLIRVRQFTKQPWQQVSRADLVAFEKHLQWSVHGRGGLYSAQTTHQALRMLRTFYRWAQTTGQIAENPMEGWLLPAPPRAPKSPLERAQVLRLLNLPDLTNPSGQRDAVLLQLLYHQGFGLEACRKLLCADLADREWEAGTAAALHRYLQDGRARLQTRAGFAPVPHLLLAESGRAYQTEEGLAARLRLYATQMGLPRLSAGLLHHSYRAHQAELQRRLPQF